MSARGAASPAFAELREARILAELYDPDDHVVSKTDALGRTTLYTYDSRGNVSAITDPLGRKTSYDYDSANNVIVVSAPGGRIEFVTYDELNRAATFTDAGGGKWISEFDALGYIVKQTDPRGAETRYEYAASQLRKVTNSLNQSVEYGYDLQGNITSFRDERGFVTSFEYDSRNRLISQTDPTGAKEQWAYDDFGSLIEYIDPMGSRTTNEYDDMHRLVRSVGFSGGQSTYAYDDVGNLITMTDPLGRVMTREYDARNRLTRVVDARAGETSYTYDEVDNLLSLTDPLGNKTQWEYDVLDRVNKTIDPLGAISTLIYDVAGNIEQTRDRLGRTRNFAYDKLDRLTQEIWRDAAGAVVDTHTFTYDRTGNMLTAVDNDSRLIFTYDALGQVTSADNTGTLGAPRVRLSYFYDAAGNRTRVSDNFNVSVDSVYNSRNLLEQRSWTGLGSGGQVSARVGMTYNARGQTTEIARFGSIAAPTPASKISLSYDESGRIARIRNTSAADAVLANYDMAWDLADQLTEWNVNGQLQRFNYDATGQLTSVARGDNANAERYQYDLNGNRQGSGQTVGANNRLLADDKFDYQYDAEGNRTAQVERATGRITSFTYDHENHLLTATTRSPAGALLMNVRYRYDALGRRNARIADSDGSGPAPATVEYYVYDSDNIWLDASGAGTVTARYLHADGIDNLLARYRPEDGLAWYVTDHLGSVRGWSTTRVTRLSKLTTTHSATSSPPPRRSIARPLPLHRPRARPAHQPIPLPYAPIRPARRRIHHRRHNRILGGDTNLNRYVGNSATFARDPLGMSTIETIVAHRYCERVGRAVAGSVSGFALGYICGFSKVGLQTQRSTTRRDTRMQ